MKSIKERAEEYAAPALRLPDDEMMNKNQLWLFEKLSFIAGAKSEREGLTRWNENLDEVPDGCNQWCIVKIQNKDGFVSYTVALALWGKLSMPDLMNGEKIIGWREIHE